MEVHGGHEYPHGTGDCSVTGGYRYRGSGVPSLIGKYLFGDYFSGSMRTTSFGEGAKGKLYATIGNNVVEVVSSATVPVASSSGWRSGLSSVMALLGVLALQRRKG